MEEFLNNIPDWIWWLAMSVAIYVPIVVLFIAIKKSDNRNKQRKNGLR